MFADDPIHSDLADMGWKSFENWTRQILVDAGFVANMTPVSGDHGADVILRDRDVPRRGAIVQVKHRSAGKLGVVSEGEVVDVLRARTCYTLDDPVLLLVTNGSVDRAGLAAAAAHSVVVVDHARIKSLASIVRTAMSERSRMAHSARGA